MGRWADSNWQSSGNFILYLILTYLTFLSFRQRSLGKCFGVCILADKVRLCIFRLMVLFQLDLLINFSPMLILVRPISSIIYNFFAPIRPCNLSLLGLKLFGTFLPFSSTTSHYYYLDIFRSTNWGCACPWYSSGQIYSSCIPSKWYVFAWSGPISQDNP